MKKIFAVDFSPMWPVPSGLIIAADDESEAKKIAQETIKHTKDFTLQEVDISESRVVFYESGDY